MKLNPRVTELSLYDVRGAPGISLRSITRGSRHATLPWLTAAPAGVAADVGHINTKSTVKGYEASPENLKEALSGSEIVLIPAGVPRKPGMTRDGIFPLWHYRHQQMGNSYLRTY